MPTQIRGLQGKVRETVKLLEALRQDQQKPREITLRNFLGEKYNLSPNEFYNDLQVDPETTTVKDLMLDEDKAWLLPELIRDGIKRGMGLAARERMAALRAAMNKSLAAVTSEAGTGGARYITPEVFLDPIMRGTVQSIFYPDLVMREIMIGNLTVTMPQIDLSEAQLVDSEEAATIEEGTVTYGSKNVTVRKKARGIQFTYESIEFNTLDLVAVFFEDFGRLLGHSLNGEAVLAIINGDQDDGSEAASVIGVTNPANGIQYIDVLRVWIRLALLGRASTSIIGNETTALLYLLLEEVLKTQFNGDRIAPTRIKVPLPTMQDLYLSIKVPGSKMIFQDSSASLVQLTARPLLLESEAIVKKQLKGTYASIYTGFAKVNRNASVVVDGSVAFADNGWPAWMSPFPEDNGD